MEVLTNDNITLGILSTISRSQNPNTSMSLLCFSICIVDQREFCGGGSSLLGNSSLISLTMKIDDDASSGGSKRFLTSKLEITFSIVVYLSSRCGF